MYLHKAAQPPTRTLVYDYFRRMFSILPDYHFTVLKSTAIQKKRLEPHRSTHSPKDICLLCTYNIYYYT